MLQKNKKQNKTTIPPTSWRCLWNPAKCAVLMLYFELLLNNVVSEFIRAKADMQLDEEGKGAGQACEMLGDNFFFGLK